MAALHHSYAYPLGYSGVFGSTDFDIGAYADRLLANFDHAERDGPRGKKAKADSNFRPLHAQSKKNAYCLLDCFDPNPTLVDTYLARGAQCSKWCLH